MFSLIKFVNFLEYKNENKYKLFCQIFFFIQRIIRNIINVCKINIILKSYFNANYYNLRKNKIKYKINKYKILKNKRILKILNSTATSFLNPINYII